MEIRKTRIEEIDVIMRLYDRAREFMRKSGNVNQWINGYPSEKIIKRDIIQGNSYVCEEEDGRITGVFCFMEGTEPAYRVLEGGHWLNDAPYGVIHRLASTGERKRFAEVCLEWCFARCNNIRVDTHADNQVMRKLLMRNGFRECGIISVEDGSPRIAYQKCIPV